MGVITVFIADDSVFIREGVKAMLSRQADLEIVGEAEDHDGLVDGAESAAPNVVVSDIRMPPNFHREGIEACKLIRKRHPGTGIVILSQYDDPDYAIALLSEGAAGYAYLLKDRIAEGDQLARAIREVASGGSMLDPAVVSALMWDYTRDQCSSAAPTPMLIVHGRRDDQYAPSNGGDVNGIDIRRLGVSDTLAVWRRNCK